MADNEQNTYSGGGGALVAPTGNGILDSFLRLADVAVTKAGSYYGVYDSIRERELAAEIARRNAVNPPQQTMPARMAFSPADYLSNPQNVQRSFIFAGVGIILAVTTVYAFRKVF